MSGRGRAPHSPHHPWGSLLSPLDLLLCRGLWSNPNSEACSNSFSELATHGSTMEVTRARKLMPFDVQGVETS